MAIALTASSQAEQKWTAEHMSTLSGFNVPECALHVPTSGLTYVSNIECQPDGYWLDDSKGFLSTIGKNNKVSEGRWIDSQPDHRLNGPKGMCQLGQFLYFTDNTRLMRCSLSGEDITEFKSGFKTANDLATDGQSIWLSDNVAGKVFCISPDGDQREIKAPTGINGITFDGNEMYGVSWDLHEIYQLDPTGENEPIAFGLASHFKNLDGIEVLKDGSFIISDFIGNAVYLVGADRTSVKTLIEVPTPADIGINRKDGLLYVPQFMKDKVSIYQLKSVTE